ncbi:MAG: dephospho-CoA kinase [Bacteroidetes bacterium]|nr:dephospho-CoA kinase [Bacteroidota bacterium]
MIRAGITGGIGSGKTTVCRFFEFLRTPIYYADTRAKELMNTDPELGESIRKAFGHEAYTKHGLLNRAFLANEVFKDDHQLKVLNSLVHPAVWKDVANWLQIHHEAPYTLYEAAILFETGSYKMFDKVITVFAPEEMRIKRVMERDGVGKKEVLARMDKQMADENKIKLADYVIYNDMEHSLVSQILTVHKELILQSNS